MCLHLIDSASCRTRSSVTFYLFSQLNNPLRQAFWLEDGDFSGFISQIYISTVMVRSSEDRPYFSDIINRILILYNVKAMNTFTLSYEKDEDDLICEYQIETWVATVVSRKVKKLELSLDFPAVMLPRSIFTCKTLVDLTLEYCKLPIPFPSAICLPSLKTLTLRNVQYNFDETLSNLISGCPVLEELEINTILEEDLFCCNISSPTIKWLKVFFSLIYTDSDSHDYRLEINAPALRYLEVHDNLSEYISTEALASLIRADICLYLDEEVRELEDPVAYSGTVLEFLDRLCNVKCLKLRLFYNKFLDSAFAASPIRFHNLTKLELVADWLVILKFLQSADNLEVLIIRELDEDLKCWIPPEQVPPCPLSHLTTLRVDYYRLAKNEFEIIRYFLRNAQVLKMMEIYPRSDVSDYEKKFCALKKISLFERGSVACKLDFH